MGVSIWPIKVLTCKWCGKGALNVGFGAPFSISGLPSCVEVMESIVLNTEVLILRSLAVINEDATCSFKSVKIVILRLYATSFYNWVDNYQVVANKKLRKIPVQVHQCVDSWADNDSRLQNWEFINFIVKRVMKAPLLLISLSEYQSNNNVRYFLYDKGSFQRSVFVILTWTINVNIEAIKDILLVWWLFFPWCLTILQMFFSMFFFPK